MTCFSITEPVFRTEPLFLLGCSAREAEQYLRKRYRLRVSIDSTACGTMMSFRRYPHRVVWSDAAPSGPKALAQLLHELVHLVVRICGDKGVPIHPNIHTGECGDETAAYLFEFFAYEILRRATKRKRGSNARTIDQTEPQGPATQRSRRRG